MRRVPVFDRGNACALAIRDTIGSAAALVARCKNVRREIFIMFPHFDLFVRVSGRYGMSGRVHSGLMLEARITLPHFAVSSAISFPNSPGNNERPVLPRS